MPNPADWLITPDLKKPREWTYPIDHKAIKLMRDRVGRESDKTTERLSAAVGGRTVALLLGGASIRGLEDRMEQFANFDLCYMGVNRFMAIERNILTPRGKEFDVIFCMSEQDIPRRLGDILTFLGRDSKKLLMTTLCAMTWLDKDKRDWILDTYGEQLYLMPRLLCRPEYPISLELIIDQLILAKVDHLILFGADGYLEPGMKGKSEKELIRWDQQRMLSTYYDPEFFKKEKRATGVGIGTVRFNRNFRYQPDKMRIVNCSPDSHYAHIPKMGYDEVLSALAIGGYDGDAAWGAGG